MAVTVETRLSQEYPPYCIALLEQLFADSRTVVITKQFTEGQSGTFVLLVEPTDQQGERALPAVVKIGPRHLLEEEQHAAQTYMADRLPDFVPFGDALATVNVSGAAGSTETYSAARYALAGNGIFTIETLRGYALHAPQDALWTVLEKRLFPQFDRIWSSRAAPLSRRVSATYDRVLPVNLLLEATTTMPTAVATLDASADPAAYPPLQHGDGVQLRNFVVTEIEAAAQTLTLNLPNTEPLRTDAYRVRIRNVANIAQYKLHDPAAGLTGQVITTRHMLLRAAVAAVLPPTVDLTQQLLPLPTAAATFPTNPLLPNPLLQWPALLREVLPMRIGTVHGDLNTGNVLIDVEAKATFIIDCAHAHHDHALYDLARLESELLLHLVADRFFDANLPPTAIYELYTWLDFVTKRAPNSSGLFSLPEPLLQTMPPLQGAFIALTTIRNAARRYLADPAQWREYYVALTLTLLGSLKFATLDRVPAGMNPKAVAFWGAATLLAQLAQSVNLLHIDWRRVAVHEVAAAPGATADGKPNVYVEPATMQQGDVTHDVTHDHRQGVFFEGNQSVQISGNVISGGTHNTTNATNMTNFNGPVTGSIHTGSGDIHVSGAGTGGADAREDRDQSVKKK